MSSLQSLTPAQRLALEKRALENNFYMFVKKAWQHVDPKKFKDNWHIKAICDHLQAVHEGDLNRLLVNVPPGAGKSLIASVFFPAWVWTTQPTKSFIATSFSMRRSSRDSRKMRKLIESDWYQARWRMGFASDQNEKLNFENEFGGSRVAEPFSQMTGSRGNYIIIDDPHSVDSAKSVAERSATVETFLDAIPNRLNDLEEDAIICIMQRLHEEDVSGAILERPDLGYEHLCIPMEYEGAREPTSIGWMDPREVEGELMFPDHFSFEAVKKLKASYTPTTYAGQYQQRPAPKDSGEIDIRWFAHTRFDLKTDKKGETGRHCYPGMNFYMTSDHAPGGEQRNDWNVIRIWGIDHKRHFWLVDSFRKKCRLNEAFGVVRDMDGKLIEQQNGALALIKKWRPLAYFPEDDNNWKGQSDTFIQAMRESGHYCRTDPISPHGSSKSAKAEGYCILAMNGQVHLPKGKIGDDALAEYAVFPNGKHDDQCDADSMIGRVQTKMMTGYLPMPEDVLETAAFGYGGKPDEFPKTDAATFFL